MAVLTTTKNLLTRVSRYFDISSLGSFDLWMSIFDNRLTLQINKTLDFFLLVYLGIKKASKVKKLKSSRTAPYSNLDTA